MGKRAARAWPARPKLYQGLDLSPNHAGFVEVDARGDVRRFAFVTTMESVATANPETATFLDLDLAPPSKRKKRKKSAPEPLTAIGWKIHRLLFMGVWLAANLSQRAELLAIENYAYGKKTGAYEIGEVGGIARKIAADMRRAMVLVNPKHVKRYAQIESKEKPIARCWEWYGQDWQSINSGRKSCEAAGDLADAHMLAMIARDIGEGDNEDVEFIMSKSSVITELDYARALGEVDV